MNKAFPPFSSSFLKNMALTEDAQNSLFLDALLCEEDGFTEYGTEGGESYREKSSSLSLILLENDVFSDDDDGLISLISKERGTHLGIGNIIIDETLKQAREETVFWVLKVCAQLNFSALISVLAVNYFDRFIQSLQQNKPWTTQLAAVACLNVAVKMEESQGSCLLDLQVEESKFEFEAKDVKRMELLVLSTLEWRMNPVTPISFFGHFVRTLRLKSHLHCEFLWRCERVLLLVLADLEVMSYLPSVIAAATMVHVIREIEPFNVVEYRNQLLGLLKICEEQMSRCYKLVLKILCCNDEDIKNLQCRRKRQSEPRSPDGVIDAFLNNTSNDSWASVTVSEEPMLKKKKRSREQPMQLSSLLM